MLIFLAWATCVVLNRVARFSKKSWFGGTKLPFNPASSTPLRVRSKSPDLAAVTIVTRFLRNYPLPYSYQNNKTEKIKAQVKPYSFDQRQFFFFGFHLVKGVRGGCIAL